MSADTPEQVTPERRPRLPDVMDEGGVCQYLTISPSMLARLVTAGEIQSFLIGRSRKYHGPSVAEYVERQIAKGRSSDEGWTHAGARP